MTYAVQLPNDPNLIVDIRADDISIRCGSSTDHTIPVANVAPYSATILNNGQPVAQYSLPQHDRFSRWIYPITPETIIRAPAQIFAQGLMFPFGNPGKKTPAKPTNKYTGPLSTAGITTSMGSTGERNDIGEEPEWEAYFLRTGDAGPMLEAVKGFFSMPTKIIDERTGRLWDLIAKPNATTFWGQSGIPDYIAMAAGGQWSMDVSHHPAIYCAYLATGRLCYLEELSFIAQWGFLITNWYTSITGNAVVNLAQERGAGWHFRSLLMVYMATLLAEKDYPNGLPKPLMPSSYWLQHIDNQYQLFSLWINDPANDVWRQFPDVTGFRPWQNDYFYENLCLAALFFPNSKWTQVCLWAMKDPIMRLSGADGYPPCHIGPYQFPTGPNMPDGDNNWPGVHKAAEFFPTRGAAFQSYAAKIKSLGSGWNMTAAQIDAILADPLGGGHIISWDPYPTLTLRSLMAAGDFLDKNGYVPLSKTYPEWDTCFTRVTNYALDWEAQAPNNIIPSRVSIMSTIVAPAPPNPPPVTQPPTSQPPVTGVSMPTTFNVAVGSTIQLDLTPTPADGDLSSLTYRSVPPEASSLTPNATGVAVKRLLPVAFQVFADVNGADASGAPAKIEAESDSAALVIVPLVTALVLAPHAG